MGNSAEKTSSRKVVATFHEALKPLDASEESMRSMIERDLYDFAGAPNSNTPKSAKAVADLMKKISVVRVKAIKQAFRHLRDNLPSLEDTETNG